MREDSEGTPLLRGHPAGGLQDDGAPASKQAVGGASQEDVGCRASSSSGSSSRRIQSRFGSFVTRDPRHFPLPLAVAAVGVGVLVFTVGFMSMSGTVGQLAGDASLAATAAARPSTAVVVPGDGKRGVTGAARGARDGGLGHREEGHWGGTGSRVGGAGEDGGSKTASGGWRSQAERSPGLSGNGRGVDGKNSAPSFSGARTAGSSKPNVFFVLIDDMGSGDIGYQSTDLYELTPNLDALAAGGVKLTNYYTMTLCTPARASIMTGRYPLRFGMQHGVIMPGMPYALPLDEKIFPEYMNEAGYESHMVGKWHLGSHATDLLPSRRGFKTFLGYLNGVEHYYTHKNPEASLNGKYFFDFGYGNETGYYDVTRPGKGPCSDGTPSLGEGVETWEPGDVCLAGTYSTDAFVGRARQIVNSKTPFDEEPLFLYLAHQAVHSPVGPAPREEFTAEEEALLEAVEASTGSANRKKFAGVLQLLDKRIGSFVDMLEQEGWLENSVIVVASDNGACPDDGGTNYPLRGTKQSLFEGGSKVPALVWSKSHLPSEVWGASYDNIMHSTDWLPTLMSLAGGEISGSAGALDGVDHWEAFKSTEASGVEGAPSDPPRTEVVYNWDPYMLTSVDDLTEDRALAQGAFRSGDWKLLVNVWCSGYYSHDPDVLESDTLVDPSITCGGTGECQDCIDFCQTKPDTYATSDRLYNIKDDPREENDLFDLHPEIAQRLRQRAEEIVYADYAESKLLPVNEQSYGVFKKHDWWMLPWIAELEQSKNNHNLDGLMR